MTRDEAEQIENQVRATLRDGGDLQEALARIDRVVAAYPQGTHALALRGMVLQGLGPNPEAERALVASFQAGLANRQASGEATVITLVHPALDLASYLDAGGRRQEAAAVIAQAISVVPHEHAALLFKAREKLTDVADAGTVLPQYKGHDLLTFEQAAQRYGVKLPPGMKAPPTQRSSGIDTGGIGFLVLVGVGTIVGLGLLIRLVLYLVVGK